MELPAGYVGRIKPLNTQGPGSGDFVLYWMQQSQRAASNHALEFAVLRANELDRPLLVLFLLVPTFPDANLRHFAFMLDGLSETERQLKTRGIGMVAAGTTEPVPTLLEMSRRAAAVICDCGYLRHQRKWRRDFATQCSVEVTQVEADVVVPVEIASQKAEFAARTIRPRIKSHVEEYLRPLAEESVGSDSMPLTAGRLGIADSVMIANPSQVLARLSVDRSVPPSALYRGGRKEGMRRLRDFVENRLPGYYERRNQPDLEFVSHMSPYLHFGQLSPLEVALEVQGAGAPQQDRDSYLEELIIRRELACNYVHFNPGYDRFEALPAWAQATLTRHAADRRPAVYAVEELEMGQTADSYWNAAMLEMRVTGYMHNYMRMYWGKKLLEWSPTPEQGYYTALYLNNKYFLDGRDPSGYANVGWIFGLHDRPWGERPVFGTVRSMTAGGLERKFDPDKYVEKVRKTVSALNSPTGPKSGGF